ncbi:MAG: RIP metalloprotease RseP [Halanaerobiales bacterium]|nr:RIP metalloprotease RseP [Halanaerobiales bacterium]
MLITIISFIIVLGILIFIHELGHYITAKWAGIRVEEFALGFGPILLSHKKGETVYSLRGIPLGGFCKLTGEFPPDEDMSPEEKRIYQEAREKGQCFDQKPAWKRLAVLFNGPLMNFLLAVLIFMLIFTIYGQIVDSTVLGEIIAGRPAAEAGFQVGDRITAINGQEITSWEQLANIIHGSAGQELKIELLRQGQLHEVKVVPQYDESSDGGIIGIFPELVREEVGVFQAIRLGAIQGWYILKLTIIGFYQMLTGQISADIGGPVMIANLVGQALEIGLNSLLNLMAILSINLGIINLVPFPALDGGRILFILVELIRGKPVDPKKEGLAHVVGFVVLMVLMAFLVYKDLGRVLF